MSSFVQQIEEEEVSLPKENLIIPLEYTKLLITEEFETSEILIQDNKSQIYAKAISGPSTLTFKNGNSYKGDVSKGMMHGKGVLKWESGVKYEGDFVYNSLTGNGEYFWTDGSYYKGQVVNGLRHGQGVFEAADKKATYTGQWYAGQRTGKGKIVFPSGGSYDGDFKNGVKDGKGVFKYSSGNYYEGEFKQNAKHGQGVMHWLDTSEKYNGNWEKDKQNGFGEHIWLENKGEKKQLRNRYQGQWLNGERHGYGIFYYADGSKYSGEWKNNLKEGYAMFTAVDGTVIQGYFKQDKLFKNILDTYNQASTLSLEEIQGGDSPHLTSSSNTPKINRSHKPSQRLEKNPANQPPNHRPSIVPPAAIANMNKTSSNLQVPSNANKKQSGFKPPIQTPESEDQKNKSLEQKQNNNTADKQGIQKQTSQQLSSVQQSSSQQGQQSNQSPQQTPHLLSTQSQKQKEIQDNPYVNILDISDLDLNFKQPTITKNHIDTILLRNNSQLIQWFRECSTRFENSLGEQSFSMDMMQIWRFLKEIKVLGDSLTLSVVDRQFARGNKNNYLISMTEQDIVDEIILMKQINRFITEEERKDIKLLEYVSNCKKKNKDFQLFSQPRIDVIAPQQFDDPNDKDFYSNKRNIHSESQVILYRHFVDIIVRVAFLRALNPENIGQELEIIIEHHIKPWIENKKKSKIGQKNIQEEELQVLSNKVIIMRNQLKVQLNIIFDQVKKINKDPTFGFIDETCQLIDIIKLFKMEKIEVDQNFLFSILEFNFDPQHTVSHVDTLIKEREKEREREILKANQRRNQKGAQPRKKTPDFSKMKEQRQCKLIKTELIYAEFARILLMIKEHSPKVDDENLEKRLKIAFEKLLKSAETMKANSGTNIEGKVAQKQWPTSMKDMLKVELQKERIRKAELEKERKRREEERKKEQRERAQMALQDYNIPTDVEDDSFDEY